MSVPPYKQTLQRSCDAAQFIRPICDSCARSESGLPREEDFRSIRQRRDARLTACAWRTFLAGPRDVRQTYRGGYRWNLFGYGQDLPTNGVSWRRHDHAMHADRVGGGQHYVLRGTIRPSSRSWRSDQAVMSVRDASTASRYLLNFAALSAELGPRSSSLLFHCSSSTLS